MILGTGIDIIEIRRMEKAIERTPRILDRLFTHAEMDYFNKRNNKGETYAAGFAAKEAILKAFGTGLRNLDWRDIEVLRNEMGAPVVNLYRRAKNLSNDMGVTKVHISISHSKEYSIASVIFEGKME